MRVLSLFDGISCGKVVLGNVDYISSEIDPYAIKVSEINYPSLCRLGGVKV
jgi:hypothetical protein